MSREQRRKSDSRVKEQEHQVLDVGRRHPRMMEPCPEQLMFYSGHDDVKCGGMLNHTGMCFGEVHADRLSSLSGPDIAVEDRHVVVYWDAERWV